MKSVLLFAAFVPFVSFVFQMAAPLLLNAGTPTHSVTLQRILGHQRVRDDAAVCPALRDSTIARDYGRAMAEVEDGDARSRVK